MNTNHPRPSETGNLETTFRFSAEEFELRPARIVGDHRGGARLANAQEIDARVSFRGDDGDEHIRAGVQDGLSLACGAVLGELDDDGDRVVRYCCSIDLPEILRSKHLLGIGPGDALVRSVLLDDIERERIIFAVGPDMVQRITRVQPDAEFLFVAPHVGGPTPERARGRPTVPISLAPVDQLVERGGILVLDTEIFDPQSSSSVMSEFVGRVLAELNARVPRIGEPDSGTRVSVVFSHVLCAHPVQGIAALLRELADRGVGITATIRSRNLLTEIYGTDGVDMIERSFGTAVFAPGLDDDDASLASRRSGTMTIHEAHVTEEYTDHDEEWRPISRTKFPYVRPVLLPTEVKFPKEHFLLGRPHTVFLPDMPPFQAFLASGVS